MDLDREGKMPVPIGIFAASNLKFHKLPLEVLGVTQNQNLQAVAEDYDLAILQLPFLTIPMESSLLGAYVGETGRQISPKVLVSPRIPFVVGLEIVLGQRAHGWDHKLIIIDKGYGQHLVDWLGTVALNDPVKKIGYRIRVQSAVISDVIEFEKHTQDFKVPMLKVPALCVESTRGCYYFMHKQKIGLTYPVLVKEDTPSPDFDAFLGRLRAGANDLYGASNASRNQTEPNGGPNLLHGRDPDKDGRNVDN